MDNNVLVITPIDHVDGLRGILEKAGKVIYLDNPTVSEVQEHIADANAIYTNPNKSNVYLSNELLNKASSLEVICTSSTGTTHIDLEAAEEMDIDILSLKDEQELLQKIPSTAELAIGLMFAGVRNIPQCWDSVRDGNWDYNQFIGRQMDHLTVGIIGYGRLGSMFAEFCRPYGGEILAYDPYVNVTESWVDQVDNLEKILKECHVISLHVHVSNKTEDLIDKSKLLKMRSDVVLINTSRGEIVDEEALISFLEQNPDAYYATDVITDEVQNKSENKFRQWAISEGESQTLITPHVGGITKEATQVAWCHAAEQLIEYFQDG